MRATGIFRSYCLDKCRTLGYTKMGRTIIGVGMYDMGYKYCSTCSFWFALQGVVCPCCHRKLRITPRRPIRQVKRY